MKSGRPRKSLDNEEVCKRYAGGESSKSLAKEFGVSTCAIINMLRVDNIPIRSSGPKAIITDLKSMKKIIKRYNSGESANSIAENIGVKHHTVEKWLKESGVKMRGMTAFGNVDEHFFDNIDSEEKAYWLGFLAADGNLSKNGMTISIVLKKDDEEHLIKFKKAINSKAKIGNYKRKNRRFTDSYIFFKSRKMWMALNQKWGLKPNKTFDYDPIIPKGYERHFWRGMIDGDGCMPELSRAGSTRYSIELTGTNAVCVLFLSYATRVFGYGCGSISEHKGKTGSWSKVSIEGQAAKMVIADLYNNANVYLSRKMELAQRKKANIDDGIHEIGQVLCSEFLKENHYLYSSPVGMRCIGLWKDKCLIGVAAFGVPSSMGSAESIFGVDGRSHVWELRRFALKKGYNIPNLASQFLSSALDKICLLKPDIWAIIAFSDENVGHYGTIYKACNAIYLGKTSGGVIARDSNNRIFSGRHLNKIKSLDGITFDIDKGRHKFLFILGKNRTDKKTRTATIKAKIFVSDV